MPHTRSPPTTTVNDGPFPVSRSSSSFVNQAAATGTAAPATVTSTSTVDATGAARAVSPTAATRVLILRTAHPFRTERGPATHTGPLRHRTAVQQPQWSICHAPQWPLASWQPRRIVFTRAHPATHVYWV